MAVDDVGTPTQFLHRFQYAAGIEDGTGIIVFILFTIFVCYLQAVLKVVIVVDEVYLHTCRLDRGNLDDERVIGIVNDEVHAGESYHLMQLVSAFVDISPFGHKRSDFSAFFLNSLR